LDDDTVRAIVAKAREHDEALGLLIDVLAVTGTRRSQVARLVVADLLADPPRLLMPRSGKGGSRNRVARKSTRFPVPIMPALALRLKAAAAGRAGNAPLLLQADGATWDSRVTAQRYAMREVVAAVGLDPDTVTMYALRHSSITRQLLLNVPIRIVASAHDTSVGEIEAHYSRHISEHSDDLSRRALLQDEPAAGNVVSIVTGR
jgi:integrase